MRTNIGFYTRRILADKQNPPARHLRPKGGPWFRLPGYLILLWLLAIGACQPKGPVRERSQAVNSKETVPTYTNPVLAHNFPDPTVIKAPDGFYYAYGTNSEVAGKVQNIQVAKSVDLVNWEMVGDALPQKPSWADTDFWAPHVLYAEALKKYVLFYSGESTDKATCKCLGIAFADNPTGPFRYKGTPLLCGEGFENIDPMVYQEPGNGRNLFYWGSGFEPILVQEMTGDWTAFKPGTTPKPLVWPDKNKNYNRLLEGAWLDYHNGKYYLYYSGDNCCGDNANYAVMVARADNPEGPFTTLGESNGTGNSVILERNDRWIAPGHHSFVTDAAGQSWMVYHAIDANQRQNGRKMLLDKMVYRNSWPVMGNGTPSVSAQPAPARHKPVGNNMKDKP